MKNTKTRLVLLFKVIVALAALGALLLVAGRDLYPFISPWKLILYSSIGVAMFLAIVLFHAMAVGADARNEASLAVDAASGDRESARWMPLEIEPPRLHTKSAALGK